MLIFAWGAATIRNDIVLLCCIVVTPSRCAIFYLCFGIFKANNKLRDGQSMLK